MKDMQRNMISYCFLICIIIYTNKNDATHFLGGTITYKVLNTSGSVVTIVLTQTYIYDYTKITCTNSMIANQTPKLTFNPPYRENSDKVNCTQYCNQSGGYIPPSVVSYCIDYSSALGITVGQRSDTINITNGSYFFVAYQSTSWRQLTLPVTSGALNTTWSISCLINLRMRPDSSYNNPPAATIISPIYIPVGIPQSIFIPTIDADNDNVRCRFSNGISECGSTCPPSSLPNGTILFSNCTLIITGIKVNDWYAMTIQIEDFSNSTSTTPLSTVPVQFLINVQNVPSCSRRPLLTGPVAQTGDCVGIRVGQPYTIQLIAENFCPNSTSIIDIATLSFPIVNKTPIVRNTTTLWSISLIWTPTAAAVGTQILCAVAIDSMNVQSNQYCMTFTVAQGTVPACPGQMVMTSSFSSILTSIQTSSYKIDSTTTLNSLSTIIPSTVQTVPIHQSTFQSTTTTTEDSAISLTSEDSLILSSSIHMTSMNTNSEITALISTKQSITNNLLETSKYSTMSITNSFTASTSVVSSTILVQQSFDTSSSWPWLAILLAAIAILLIALCLCCCFYWYCCPRLCVCCPCKRRRKRPSLDKFPPENHSVQQSITPRTLTDSFTNGQYLNDDTFLDSRPSSVASSRNVDDIQLPDLTSRRKIKLLPHYTLAIQRSPRITPILAMTHK